MNYSKIFAIVALFSGTMACGMQPLPSAALPAIQPTTTTQQQQLIPSSALPIQPISTTQQLIPSAALPITQPNIAATIITRDETPEEILGVREGASREEIHEAYKKLALKWHPDRNKSPQAPAQFMRIIKAYERLNPSTQLSILFHAISSSNTKEIAELLKYARNRKELVSAYDSQGNTMLMRAINTKNPQIVRLLLENGANPNQTSNRPSAIPPLREAMIAGNIDVIKELLRFNVDVNVADSYGITPLMMAVSQGPAQAVFILIEAGADVNVEDKGGQTVWKYSTFSSPRKVSPAEKAEIQRLLEAKSARKESIKKQAKK